MSDDETILRTNLPLIRALLPTPQGRAVYWAVDEIDRLRAKLERMRSIAFRMEALLTNQVKRTSLVAMAEAATDPFEVEAER